MATFIVNDRVEIRAAKAHITWRPGAVSSTSAGLNGGCYEITLDLAVSANDWSGMTRNYIGTNTLTKVFIYKHQETLDPGALIKAEV